jgi:hypothetical protein
VRLFRYFIPILRYNKAVKIRLDGNILDKRFEQQVFRDRPEKGQVKNDNAKSSN